MSESKSYCGSMGPSTAQEETIRAQQHVLIQQVNDWECNALNQIHQTAEEARRLITKHTTDRIRQVEMRLAQLTEQLRQCHLENHFIPGNVSQWHNELTQLTQQLVVSSTIEVRKTSTPLVTKIFVHIPEQLQSIDDGTPSVPNLPVNANAKWLHDGITIAGGNGQGDKLDQFNGPCGLFLHDDQTMYITDWSNNRVVEWKYGATSGQVVAGGNGEGKQDNQLIHPTALIVHNETDSLIICDSANRRIVRWPRRNGTRGETILSDIVSCGLMMGNDGYLYASDCTKHEVRRWKMGEMNSTVVAGGNGEGDRLDQLRMPMDIFVDRDHAVYVSDYKNHRVVKWVQGARQGIIVAAGQGDGNGLGQLSHPRGLIVDQSDAVYVADRGNHRVMRWTKGATEGSVVVGGNGQGSKPNQLNSCLDLAFDGYGNLFVSDYNNYRVQTFNIAPLSIQ